MEKKRAGRRDPRGAAASIAGRWRRPGGGGDGAWLSLKRSETQRERASGGPRGSPAVEEGLARKVGDRGLSLLCFRSNDAGEVGFGWVTYMHGLIFNC